MTRTTQKYRVPGGGALTWQGIGQNQPKTPNKIGIVTHHKAVVTRRLNWKDGRYDVSVGAFTLLSGLAAVATPLSTQLLFLSLLGLESDVVLNCCAFCISGVRRSTTYTLLLLNKSSLHVVLFGFLHTSEPLARDLFAASVHCFSSVGKCKNDSSRFSTTHPVLLLPSRVALFSLQLPQHHSFR